MEAKRLRDATKVKTWLRERLVAVALGIDTLLAWAWSGARPCDDLLRKLYKDSTVIDHIETVGCRYCENGQVDAAKKQTTASVVAQNSLRSAMTLNGALVAMAAREGRPEFPVVESHPKLLLRAAEGIGPARDHLVKGYSEALCRGKWPRALREAAAQLEALDDHEVPAQIAARLAAIPLPPRLTDLYRPSDRRRAYRAESAQDNVVAAAILIRLHGEPVMRPTVVHPRALHRFEVEARVSGWPEGADALMIKFLSVHPRDVLNASDVRFTIDEMVQPLEIRVAGDRPPGDPPLELTAQAAFVVNGLFAFWVGVRVSSSAQLCLPAYSRARMR